MVCHRYFFGRWPGAMSDVGYAPMSDEQFLAPAWERQRAKKEVA